LAQSHACAEILVIDDGSTDDTWAVAAHFPTITYHYQGNRGLSSARNRGLRESTSSYITYLDADDVLEPSAVAIGKAYLDANPHWAFVSGGHRRVEADLQPIEECRWTVHSNHYEALLRGNYIGMHAAVLYRREALEKVKGFDESLRACEDYDLYLRLARVFPVGSHCEVVAAYRQHGENMSRDPAFMQAMALEVHGRQSVHIQNDSVLKNAYAIGRSNWREYFGDQVLRENLQHWPRNFNEFTKVAAVLWRYPYVHTISRRLRNSPIRPRRALRWLRSRIQASRRRPHPIQLGSFRSPLPLGTVKGDGSVVDRYCRRFREHHSADIRLRVCEIGPNGVPVTEIPNIPSESHDCVICILQLRTFRVDEAIGQLHRILKPSGVLLAVLPGVVLRSSVADENDYWRYTFLAAQRLFAQRFSQSLEVRAVGNVVTALAALHDLPADHLEEADFLRDDPQQQLLIMVRAVKD